MPRTAPILAALALAAAPAAAQTVESPGGAVRLRPAAEPGIWALETTDGVEELAAPAGFRASAAVELDAGWLVAGAAPEGAGHRLVLVRRGDPGPAELAPPPGRVGLHRIGPVPLAASGQLLGLAWLEGDGPRSLAVRAAVWTGADWAPGPWVSAAGPGSQLALAGAVLGDGRWLLVWSAFDGEDDEIHWSVGDGESFSPPVRLLTDNRVPDITPALVGVPGGALAAWSRYDGNDYRLRLARFDGAAWSLLRWAGGRGSLEAGFLIRGLHRYLLYRTVAGDSWDLLQLSARGRVRRFASAPGSPAERPRVELEGGRPRLSWPDRDAEIELEWRRP